VWRTRSLGHSCQDRLSRDLSSNVVVGQIAAGLGKWQNTASKLLKLEQCKLAAEGIANDITTSPPGLLADSIELPLEVPI
jgi:hypothetical protein